MAQIDDVALVPQPRRVPRVLVGLGVDRAKFGADDRPASLGLHAAKARLRPRPVRAVAGAVRGLPETVAHRLRAERNRLKQDVVRSEEHTSELQSLAYLVCRLLLEKKNNEN